MKTDNSIGLYVHIPFCVRKCAYCDFASFPLADLSWRAEYIYRLSAEIEQYSGQNISVDTVFFGGGTPSLLSGDDFSRITDSIRKSFSLSSNLEFTMEANPGTVTRENLKSYVECGVNRLSVGLQSIHQNELKMLGRIHSYDDFLRTYELARECGIENLNVDLMYGIPEQTVRSFTETVGSVAGLSPEHISVYGLILEDGTRFSRMRDKLVLPDEDTECDMYYAAAEILSRHGYEHYEISNYAKRGKRCAHNLKYWNAEEYIGVGIAAYSYFRGRRFGNTKDPRVYISNFAERYEYDEVITASDAAYEYAMLALRTSDGIDLREYRSRFDEDFSESREALLTNYAELGFLKMTSERIALTEKGFYVSNAILSELL